jgi:3',5'-nucleoside bisphosphate phosphatase
LFQQFGPNQTRDRVDLHIHSTFSDGEFNPEEIVQRSIRVNLFAIAITDHDTLAGYFPTKQIADQTNRLEVIPGVEITCEYQERELHLLGYCVFPDNPALIQTFEEMRQQRLSRCFQMIERLREFNVSFDENDLNLDDKFIGTLGRRHLAQLLVRKKKVRTIFEAFTHYLNKPEIVEIPKMRLPVQKAIELVHQAGGVCSWAHPSTDCTMNQIEELKSFGLDAIEVEYPFSKASHGKRLRQLALEFDLAITGGSDCHGASPNSRAIGCRGIKKRELERLRRLSLVRDS